MFQYLFVVTFYKKELLIRFTISKMVEINMLFNKIVPYSFFCAYMIVYVVNLVLECVTTTLLKGE